VAVDSDEHDTEGHITEDLDLRIKMVDKRLSKAQAIANDMIPPELLGPEDYKTLIVCWGSTYNVINEAVNNLGRDDVAFLHFKQVYPLPEETAHLLARADRTIIIENNATAQLGKLIKLNTGIAIADRILKYSGLAFTVEEVMQELKARLN